MDAYPDEPCFDQKRELVVELHDVVVQNVEVQANEENRDNGQENHLDQQLERLFGGIGVDDVAN